MTIAIRTASDKEALLKMADAAYKQAMTATGRVRSVRLLVAMMAKAAANEAVNFECVGGNNGTGRPAGALHLAGNDDQDSAGVAPQAALAAEQEQQ